MKKTFTIFHLSLFPRRYGVQGDTSYVEHGVFFPLEVFSYTSQHQRYSFLTDCPSSFLYIFRCKYMC